MQEEKEFVEEMDSDEEPEQKTERTTDKPDKDQDIDTKPTTDNIKTTIDNATTDTTETEVTEAKEEVKRVFGPMRPPENYVVPESYFDQESDRDLPEITEE